ncbi:Hypothetical protein D9617_12g036990 [Elsinoe fawcettii]|nr:Hypothetical protein D9617_12g036990 [Elsinoe fawcettii]
MPSLYANLLDPKIKEAATISGEPVKYEFKKPEEPQEEKKKPDAALRFQPVKRPVITQKQKPRPSAASGFTSAKSSGNTDTVKKVQSQGGSDGAPKVTLDQFLTKVKDDDDEGDPFAAEYNRRMDEARRAQRVRGGRKKKKKHGAGESNWVDWDAIYDPAKPTRLDLYKGSDEQSQAIHDWKMRLHAHHLRDRPRQDLSSDGDEDQARRPRQAFAPPAMFAPPSSYDDTSSAHNKSAQPPPPPPTDDPEPYVPPAPAANVPDDASGEDAYMRRLRLSGKAPPPASLSAQSNVSTNPPERQVLPPPPPPSSRSPLPAAPSMPLPQSAPAPGTTATPPPPRPPHSTPATISAAPVMYSAPPQLSAPAQAATTPSQSPPNDTLEEPEDDEPRSSRPGQKGFAKRLLQKYGWQEGQGLGASGDGITTILRHQPEKRKKRPDAEGGGFVGPTGGVARIVGGKRQKTATDEDESAAWSNVAVFRGMLRGVDVQREMAAGDLMQMMGERMGEFGVVERLFLHDGGEEGTRVYVKFTSALSAYRVVQASAGKDFLGNGRVVESGFFDAEKFEEGVYD